MSPSLPRVAIVACGALARELTALNRQLSSLMAVHCLPAALHNRPERIAQAVRTRVEQLRDQYDHIVVGYADCGTGGELDKVCNELGVTRLPGAHCYELFAGTDVFMAMHDDEPGTFYLTDYLARNFDRLVVDGLGMRDHPELIAAYFGNYRRIIYLQQHRDPQLVVAAEQAAVLLRLPLEICPTGLRPLATALDETLPARLPVVA